MAAKPTAPKADSNNVVTKPDSDDANAVVKPDSDKVVPELAGRPGSGKAASTGSSDPEVEFRRSLRL